MAVFEKAGMGDRDGGAGMSFRSSAGVPTPIPPASRTEAPASALPFEAFLDVVRDAPLISIDLIVKNPANEVLLGLRRNEPAAGFWFVPGGRVLKNETLDAAFERLTQAELGITRPRQDALFYGVWEHFYGSNAGRVAGFGTHYVVLAYQLTLDAAMLCLPQAEQHQQYRWALPEVIAAQSGIHHHSRAYFK
ncbi:GDP-mannose mannosyl hydrolase [Vogesella indigofera]|uniref:GDP-mannose mannosyl hydrolase n=1 Tax=Vogesella indigofera TaxID=45465 RepID=A0ABT5I0M5_VOGIN|nr:GDP-mannose mannosyl hydrolase [Vogesella indigofera]MDC7689654.1 GDP-mannose mannosyl hydrolase [Vogesella indigofera]